MEAKLQNRHPTPRTGPDHFSLHQPMRWTKWCLLISGTWRSSNEFPEDTGLKTHWLRMETQKVLMWYSHPQCPHRQEPLQRNFLHPTPWSVIPQKELKWVKQKQTYWKKRMLLPVSKSLLSLAFWNKDKGQLMLCEWKAKSSFHVLQNDLTPVLYSTKWAEKDKPNHVLLAEPDKPYWRQSYHSKPRQRPQICVTRLLLNFLCKRSCAKLQGTSYMGWQHQQWQTFPAEHSWRNLHLVLRNPGANFITLPHAYKWLYFLSTCWDAEHGVILTQLVKLWRKKTLDKIFNTIQSKRRKVGDVIN